jgi:osmoprotectant transport system ATP-binding protein
MPPLVEFDNVSFEIGGQSILRDLSLRLMPGETLVLLGRSGSGKTTALKLVNGLLFPTSGEVRVEGRATTNWDLIQLRRSIGYVIQEIGLFPHFSVEANVGLVPSLLGWPEKRIEDRVAEMLDLVGLSPTDHLRRLPDELSGGQRQRVGVARALAADPHLLLFDEPFGALDPVTRYDVQQEFLQLRRTLEKAAIFVTHDVSEALALGTRIGLLETGRLSLLTDSVSFRTSEDPEARAFLRCLEAPSDS